MQTILVIDDDENLRDTIGVLLEREGFRAILAPDGSTLGFAKLGLSPLARTLLGAEVESLRLLARHSFRHLELPRVIHHGAWHEHGLLVMTALPAPLLTPTTKAPKGNPLSLRRAAK